MTGYLSISYTWFKCLQKPMQMTERLEGRPEKGVSGEEPFAAKEEAER
jgi:hypothetical protein